MDSSLNSFVASAFSSSSSPDFRPTEGFQEAKKLFESASAVLGSISTASSHEELTLDNVVIYHFISRISTAINIPSSWARSVYSDQSSSPEDLELAFQMNQAFVTVIGQINDCLKKVDSGDIKVTWKGSGGPGSSLRIADPPILNRKQ
jgi:hypothetical protein